MQKRESEMGGNLPVQKGASSFPDSFELFSDSAVSLFKDIINVNKKITNEAENNSLEKSEGELTRPDLKYLVEQDEKSNPIGYTSMQLAKYMISGMDSNSRRTVPISLINKYMPLSRFSEFQRSEALEMAGRIATKIQSKKKRFVDELALNTEIKNVHNNLYWEDVVRRISDEFSKTGEWFGRTLAFSEERAKKEKEIALRKVKGYEAEDFDVDLVQSMLNAAKKETLEKATSKKNDKEEDTNGSGDSEDEKAAVKEILANVPIKEIFAKIKAAVVAKEREKGNKADGSGYTARLTVWVKNGKILRPIPCKNRKRVAYRQH